MDLLKTKHRYSIWLIIFSNLLFSCKEKESKKINKSNSINQPYQYRNLLVDQLDQIPLYISPLQNDSTFISVYVTPNTPREVDINNKTEKDYFFSDTVNKLWITKYQLKQNQIQTIRSKLLLENEWTYLVMDSNSFKNIQISGVPYLYFSSHETPMGRAVDMNQEVNFHLINLIDISDYCLVYEGHPSFKCADCIDGKFSDNKNLEKNPEILKHLLELSRTSKFIYQPTELDKDSLYYLNYETKWNKDNDVENIFGIGHAETSTPIKTTYYKTNLFQLNNGSITDSIENNDIKLISYFRSNLIGYDKHKKLYFPLIIENCAMDCAKTIEFFAKDSLRITYEYNGTYEISLNDIIFDSRIGK